MDLTLILLVMVLGLCSLTVYNIIQTDKFKRRLSDLEGTKSPQNITLTPIPKRVTLSDVDPGNKTIRDIMESAKLEDWSYKVEEDRNGLSLMGPSYTVDLMNPSKNLNLKCRIRLSKKSDKFEFEPYMGFLIVHSEEGSLTFDNDHEIRNELIVFIWDYVIKYHKDQNKLMVEAYNKSIDNINKKLITLSRDRKLNKII